MILVYFVLSIFALPFVIFGAILGFCIRAGRTGFYYGFGYLEHIFLNEVLDECNKKYPLGQEISPENSEKEIGGKSQILY